jgi:NADPH-dependent ferric siderophore reductase
MTSPAGIALEGTVLRRARLSEHLLRLVIGVEEFTSTGLPDEWVALTVPEQFQTRYYTVRSWTPAETGEPGELVIDVVIHEHGLVTEWAQGDCVGRTVGLSAPKGSFQPADGAGWVVLVADLTALPAVARICAETTLPVTAYVESLDGPLPDYLRTPMTWLEPPADGASGLAELVRGLSWPEGPGYFWMAGESAQMRSIRTFVRRELGWDSRSHDMMGYWSSARGRQTRIAHATAAHR